MRLLSASLVATSVMASVSIPSQSHQQQRLVSAVYEPHSAETESLLELHKSLVDIDSVVGAEYAVGVYLVSYLESHNYTVETQTIPPLASNPRDEPRHNIFAYKGTTRRTRTLPTAHLDTVAPYIPYAVCDYGSRIYGRGINDDKAVLRRKSPLPTHSSALARWPRETSRSCSSRVRTGWGWYEGRQQIIPRLGRGYLWRAHGRQADQRP